MFGIVRTLSSLAFDAVSFVAWPVADERWARQQRARTLEEIAEHLGAIRALAEDSRNLLTSIDRCAPATAGVDASALAPGPLTGKLLRVAGRGLRAWIKDEPCTGPAYWASVIAALDRGAQTQDAINLAKK